MIAKILFIICGIVTIMLNLIVFFLMRKYFSCNAYILNISTHEFYKMGVFPHIMGFVPSDENFLTDNYFGNYIYSHILKSLMLSLKQSLFYSFREYVNDIKKFKSSGSNQILFLNSQIKLNNPKYVIKQLNNKKFGGKVFKITKIYSYQLNEPDNYYIICDVIENNKKIEYKHIKLTINKLFDENNIISNYIINNCEKVNNVISY